ncbi:MAG: DNA-3-methyladenine glycosylase [Nitrososphaeria archaeon]|nr:DNA-3-methyladenine glycosylase [Aigarchaeota archaeon]MCX8187130.1 DNA-3-methyladenine glycosylase [Nitrososphaeria archaeon]MDW8021865.1 DNA-3-methyladenine glycosylase [Nitrososphaerota archaeon]
MKAASPLPREFYLRSPAEVAENLLGKILVRVIDGKRLSCRIVEAEAYYGPEDPASRARRGGDLKRTMFGDVGIALIYGIHRQWLLNVVAHEEGDPGAVLIRSGEPLDGVELMKELRGVDDPHLLTSGPGRLTKAMCIDKSFHGKPVYVRDYGLWIEEGEDISSDLIAKSHRIGVSDDLPTPLRFYIRDNKYVSRRK